MATIYKHGAEVKQYVKLYLTDMNGGKWMYKFMSDGTVLKSWRPIIEGKVSGLSAWKISKKAKSMGQDEFEKLLLSKGFVRDKA